MGIKKFLSAHSSDILTALGCIGVIGTSAMAVKCSKNEDEPNKIKRYLPTGLCGIGTICAICAGKTIDTKTIRNLSASVLYLSASLGNRSVSEAYRLPKDKYGEVIELYSTAQGNIVEDTGTGDAIFYDDFTGRRWLASYEHMQSVLEKFESDFQISGREKLNNLYEYIGISATSLGDVMCFDIANGKSDTDTVPYYEAMLDTGLYLENYPGLGWVLIYTHIPVPYTGYKNKR